MSNLADLLTKTSGVSGPLSGGLFKEVSDGSRYPYSVPSIYSINGRRNSWEYSWTNANGWTNFYTYLNGNGAPSCEMAFWHGLSQERENTMTYHNNMGYGMRRIDYGGGNVIGDDTMYPTYARDTCYGPFGVRLMFLRNFSGQDRTRTFWSSMSSYWCSGYDGAAIAIGTPNNTAYSNTTGISWSIPSYYQGSTTNWTVSYNVTIPANRTIVLMQINTFYYWTQNGPYWWLGRNQWYNTHDSFADGWIQPDFRMFWTALTYNQQDDWAYNSYSSHLVWNRCATLYGDR